MGGEFVSTDATTYYDDPRLDVVYYVDRKKWFTWLNQMLEWAERERRSSQVLPTHQKLRGIIWLDPSSHNALEGLLAVCKRLLPAK